MRVRATTSSFMRYDKKELRTEHSEVATAYAEEVAKLKT
jgi:hypothetical protein